MFSTFINSIFTGQGGSFFIELLTPLMLFAFVFGITFRALIYFTVKRHYWFAKEFEKRVNKFMDSEVPGKVENVSFYGLVKRLLEKTYFESFEMRERMRRRRTDKVMTLGDRVFLIKHGCAWLVQDILKQLKFLKYYEQNPKLVNITKATFQSNPCFNRVFGIIPIPGLHDILNIMPQLFVIGGIFGTFLGIVNGLPKLGQMNLQDMEMTKTIMDGFLLEVAFAMNSSILGIIFSVAMMIVNTLLSADRVFVEMVDSFENSLDMLWHRSDNNVYVEEQALTGEDPSDPVIQLANEAINNEQNKSYRQRELDKVKKIKTS